MHAALGIRERNIGSYSASSGSAVDFPNVTRGDLKLTGMLIDTISHIVDEEQLVPRLRACQSVAGVDKNYANGSPELTAFWHTMCGGLVWAGKSDEYKLRKVCSSDIHQYRRWRATIDSDGCPDLTEKDVATFHLSHTTVSALRKFVVTTNGHLGWAPRDARQGDFVVILSGGRLPYVLRTIKSEVREAAQSFHFVGDSYLYGAMQGELFNQLEIVDFTLI